MTELWRIDWPQGRAAPCFGLVVTDGVVMEAAPIARWAAGQNIRRVARWFYERGAAVERLGERYGRWVKGERA